MDYSAHKHIDPMPVHSLAVAQSYPPARTYPIQVLPTAVKAVAVVGHHSRVVSFPDLDLELACLPYREHAHVPSVVVECHQAGCIYGCAGVGVEVGVFVICVVGVSVGSDVAV